MPDFPVKSSSHTCSRNIEHLKHGLDESKNEILFVGYQAKGTLGRNMNYIFTH
ncbi:MAG: hypothetical protein K9L23_20580 [Desulfotignum sp.]|nr:hypothetical protein [Desulfotignum sp.]